jgi:opacity protein-like surface antigen
VVPYIGGGAGVLLYRESDEFEESDETVDDTFASYHVLGGVDVYLQPRFAIRAEFRYRAVPTRLATTGFRPSPGTPRSAAPSSSSGLRSEGRG